MTWPASFPILFRRRIPGAFGDVPIVTDLGKAPSAALGCTGWWDWTDATTMYTDDGVTPVSADGDPIQRITDKIGLAGNRWLAGAGANRPTYKVGIQNGKSVGRFDGSADTLVSALNASSYLGLGSKTIFVAGNISSFVNNDGLMEEQSGYIYVSLTTTGNRLQLWNYSTPTGGYDNTLGQAISTGTPFLYTCWHNGTALFDQLNGGTVSSGVNSGATDVLNSPIRVGQRGGLFPAWDAYHVVIANTVMSDSDRAAVNRYLMLQMNIP